MPAATEAPLPYPIPVPSPTALASLLLPAAAEGISVSLGWRFDSSGHLRDVAVAPSDTQPIFLLASLGRRVVALSEQGQVLWQARTTGPAYVVEFLEARQLFASGDEAGHVQLLDLAGRATRLADLGSRVTALREFEDGLLAAGWDARLTYLPLKAGRDQAGWTAELGSPAIEVAGIGERALAATQGGQIIAFDGEGRQVGRLDLGCPATGLQAVVVAASALALVGLQDGRLVAIEPEKMRFLWERDLGVGGPAWHVTELEGRGPGIMAGTGGSEPILAALSLEGELLWRVAMPSPVNVISGQDLDGDGRVEVLAGLASGEILVLDGLGRLRGRVHAGLPVWDLQPAGEESVLVLADVVAWHLVGQPGPSGAPWLPAPPLIDESVPMAQPEDERLWFREDDPDQATLVFVGDVALGRSIERQLLRYGPAHPWLGLWPLLSQADLAVANLECVLTTRGRPLDKAYLIRAHPQWAGTLVAGGFGLVTLANNHALDFGQAGLDETLGVMASLGVDTLGAGPSWAAAEAYRPARYTLNGVRVALLAYAAARWIGSVDVPATENVAWAEPDRMRADVRAVRHDADLVIVLLHAGTEYATRPSDDQVAVAHLAIEAGADLVIGHHPHVTQSVERYQEGLIVYSLGDAVFDIPRLAAMQGDLLRIVASPQGLLRAELWPFWIEDAIRPRLLANEQGRPGVRVIYP
jgi:poly-gamma-glutamate capsule biosynthesis protein CapA/YwtB (metallophosphatase superfamily)